MHQFPPHCPNLLPLHLRPAAQVVVVCTTLPHVAAQCNIMYGTVPLLLPSFRLSLGQVRDKVRVPPYVV